MFDFFIRITRVFWPIWPPCWGPWKADVLSIGNSHEQTQWNRVCCLMVNFLGSLFFWGTLFWQIILKFIFSDWCIISFADFSYFKFFFWCNAFLFFLVETFSLSTSFQSCLDVSWVVPVLSTRLIVLLKDKTYCI